MGEQHKSMNYLLTIIMCSSVAQTCLPPYTFEELYPDTFSCLSDGYKKSLEKTIEIGKAEVNEHGIYMKFDCKPVAAKGQAL